jgi:hypothetical protein
VSERNGVQQPVPGWFRLANRLIDQYGHRIGPYGLAVFAVLARHADSQGEAWPSRARLAELLNVSERTITRTIHLLEQEKLVVAKRSGDGMTVTRYRLLLVPEGGDSQSPVTDSHPRGRPTVTPGVTNSPVGGDSQSPGTRPNEQDPMKEGTDRPRSRSSVPPANPSFWGDGAIKFDNDQRVWVGIIAKDMAVWEKAYPACDIEHELNKMTAWIVANPRKGKKSNYGSFIVRWLRTTQDGGGSKGPTSKPQPTSSTETKEQAAERLQRERETAAADQQRAREAFNARKANKAKEQPA